MDVDAAHAGELNIMRESAGTSITKKPMVCDGGARLEGFEPRTSCLVLGFGLLAVNSIGRLQRFPIRFSTYFRYSLPTANHVGHNSLTLCCRRIKCPYNLGEPRLALIDAVTLWNCDFLDAQREALVFGKSEHAIMAEVTIPKLESADEL
jgi:hypothetical protein